MNTNQLLILGNGFDLHCGLKSSYKDFFRNAILDTPDENFDVIQKKTSATGFWEGLLFEYYRQLGGDNYNWCDIETIIKNTLWYIYYGDNEKATEIHKGLWRKALNSMIIGRNPNEVINSVESPINRYIFTYCFDCFYKMSTEQYADYIKLNLLIQNILQELHSFEKRFCEYLKGCIFSKENVLNENYIINAFNLLARLTGFSARNYRVIEDIIYVDDKQVWEKISPYQSIGTWKEVNILTQDFINLKNTNILSFNYTALFDVLDVECPCVYNNVHGKLCNKCCMEECKGSSVIFGVDDTLIQSLDANSGLRLFSKTYRKMLDTSTPISILPHNNARPLEIKFYGHSLSEADYSYFQSIFDYYDIYKNNNVSLTFYYSKGYEQTDEVYRLINSYGKTLTNENQGKNLIHKLLLENRLKIMELIED